mgnify:FL=1
MVYGYIFIDSFIYFMSNFIDSIYEKVIVEANQHPF